MGVTAARWALTIGVIVALLALDLLLATVRPHAVGYREATAWSVFYITAAVVFGLVLASQVGWGYGTQYFAGYIVEKSLSADNLFVFVIIMATFAVPREHQQRVLIFGSPYGHRSPSASHLKVLEGPRPRKRLARGAATASSAESPGSAELGHARHHVAVVAGQITPATRPGTPGRRVRLGRCSAAPVPDPAGSPAGRCRPDQTEPAPSACRPRRTPA